MKGKVKITIQIQENESNENYHFINIFINEEEEEYQLEEGIIDYPLNISINEEIINICLSETTISKYKS